MVIWLMKSDDEPDLMLMTEALIDTGVLWYNTTPQPREHLCFTTQITNITCLFPRPTGAVTGVFLCCLERTVAPRSDTGGFMLEGLMIKGSFG